MSCEMRKRMLEEQWEEQFQASVIKISKAFGEKRVESLVVDESAIALIVSSDEAMRIEECDNILKNIQNALPNLKIPVFVMDRGLKLQVLRAIDAKRLEEVIGESRWMRKQ